MGTATLTKRKPAAKKTAERAAMRSTVRRAGAKTARKR